MVDVAQPLLDKLAADCGELVRLAVIDGDDLTFVAKAQGATGALRYDPDIGLSAPLSCSAAEKYGPKAPTSVKALLPYLRNARKRGFSMTSKFSHPA